jgi:hypothetical protein
MSSRKDGSTVKRIIATLVLGMMLVTVVGCGGSTTPAKPGGTTTPPAGDKSKETKPPT